MQRQEAFLHQRATTRRAGLLKLGRTTTTASGTVLDLERAATSVAGDIFVMSTGAGVVLPRNPFPASLLNHTVRMVPSNAAASSYRLEAPMTGTFREDATQSPAVNLIQPGSSNSMTDDDVREFVLPFPFPFYGKVYDRLFVHSNGFVSFEESSPAGNRLNYSDFLSGPPKIMGAGLDLDPEFSPSGAGIYVFITDSEAIFSYVNVSQFLSFNERVNFQIRLGNDGSISLLHRQAPTGIFVMGISPGHNLGAGELVSFVAPPSGEVTDAVAEIFSDFTSGEIDTTRAAQLFFQSQPDDYDYLAIFNNQSIGASATALAYELTVRNAVTGNGDELVDRSDYFGSTYRLQAVLNMGPLQMYPADPTSLVPAAGQAEYTSLSLLSHEAGHRFLAFPQLEEAGQMTSRLIGRGGAHWSFNFNANASFMEGSDVQSTGKLDEFITGAPSLRYAELDKYLMGLVGREAVGVQQQLYYVDSGVTGARAPRRGVMLYGPARNFSIFNIIGANGPRIPDHTVSQKRFRMAFILVTADGTAPQADLDKLNAIRTAFEAHFHAQTGNLAIMDTSLKPGLNADLYPAAGLIRGSQGQLVIRRDSATASAVPLRVVSNGNAVTMASAAEIPANAKTVSIPVNAINSGVSAVTISAEDGSYLPEAINLAVRNANELELELLSGTRYQAAPNERTTTDVKVRVRDGNRLPYQGVAIQLDPTTGGTATPSPAFTDANGEATIAWTVGAESVNGAKVYISDSRATSEHSILAVESVLPSVLAGTNGASFAAGLSPGGLATLFGVSLAAGATERATAQPLPLELAGVSVIVNGTRCSLLYVSDLQINFYVPQNLSGTTALITVETPDGKSETFEAPLFTYDPAIFFDAGTNLGAVLRSGSGQKTDTVPAVPDGFVEIFATGLGPLVSPSRGVLLTEATVTATLNGAPIAVDYSGIAPGFIGLYQVNAKIPAGLAPGSYVLRLQVSGKESNAVNVVVGTPAASASRWFDSSEFKR